MAELNACCATPTVSVIIPCYNSEDYIEETIASVLGQTFCELEVLVVDDCSSDDSAEIVSSIAEKDERVRFFQQPFNQGVAKARNLALEKSRGRYIAYLDSDDLWMPEKLELQIAFLAEKGIGACFTSYETIEEDGRHINYVHVPGSITYRKYLKNTVTCSHTLLSDTNIVDKALLVMPDIRRGQDFATWVTVMKAGHAFYGIDVPLACYRKHAGSLSSNPFKSLKRTWNIYRNVEHLNIAYASYCQFWQLFHAVQKRLRS